MAGRNPETYRVVKEVVWSLVLGRDCVLEARAALQRQSVRQKCISSGGRAQHAYLAGAHENLEGSRRALGVLDIAFDGPGAGLWGEDAFGMAGGAL